MEYKEEKKTDCPGGRLRRFILKAVKKEKSTKSCNICAA